jgi:hypothetical protein
MLCVARDVPHSSNSLRAGEAQAADAAFQFARQN